MAVVSKLLGGEMPTLPWHAVPGDHWRVEIFDFEPAKAAPSPAFLEHVRRSIRRTARRTHLPLVDLSQFRAWFDRTQIVQPWIELDKLRMVSGDVVSIPVPSHLLTANEINALRIVLSRDYSPEVCAGMYSSVLFEILADAVERRLQLDGRKPAGPRSRAAERVDALLRVDGVLRRVRAESFAREDTLALWRGYQEPAELGGGYVYIGDPGDQWL